MSSGVYTTAVDDLEKYLCEIEKKGEDLVPYPIVQAVKHLRYYQSTYTWTPKRFSKYAECISSLTLPEGDPKNFVLADWQLLLLAFACGLRDPKTKKRAIRSINVIVPRKAGKSSFASAFLISELVLNRRQGAAHVIVGPTEDTARITYQLIISMLEADLRHQAGQFKQDFGLSWTQKSINCRHNGGRIEYCSAEARTLDGKLASTIYLDETSALPSSAPINTLRSGTLFNPDSIIIQTSTPGDLAQSAFSEQRDIFMDGWVKRENGGKMKKSAAIFFEADMEADWRDEKLWWRVQPMMRHMPHLIDEYRELAAQAETGPESEASFRTRQLACPIPVGHLFLRKEVLLALPNTDGPPKHAKGWHHFIGLDASDSRDTCALCLLSVDPDGIHHVRFKILYPAGSAYLGKDPDNEIDSEMTPDLVHRTYAKFAHERPEQVIICPGGVVTPEAVALQMKAWGEQVPVQVISHDQYDASVMIKASLALLDKDLSERMMKATKSAAGTTEAVNMIGALVQQGNVRLEDNPSAIHQITNCHIKHFDSGGCLISKGHRLSTAKIDSMDAWQQAMSAHLLIMSDYENLAGKFTWAPVENVRGDEDDDEDVDWNLTED